MLSWSLLCCSFQELVSFHKGGRELSKSEFLVLKKILEKIW